MTVMLKEYDWPPVATPGVPDITPVLVFKDMPVGNAPVDTENA